MAVERAAGGSSLIDVLDRVLDGRRVGGDPEIGHRAQLAGPAIEAFHGPVQGLGRPHPGLRGAAGAAV